MSFRRHRGRVILTAIALTSAALLLASCSVASSGNGDAPESSTLTNAESVDFREVVPGSGDGIKIGYISLSEAVPFIKLVSDSIKEQVKLAGAELVFCDSQGDAAKALDCAKSMKTQGVQGYLNFQADAAAAASICAAGPDVPVIAIDIEQQPCQVAFAGANNGAAGFLVGEEIGNYFKDTFNCEYDSFVSLEQPEAGAVNTARMGGVRDGFASVCGEVENLRELNAFRIDMAQKTFADTLTALPGQDKIIVVGINDDSVLGALAAAKTAGREGDIYMGAQGADPSSWCEIKNNPNWIADAGYFPERYGEIAVPYLLDTISGKDVPKLLYVPHIAITGKNISDHYDVSC